MSAPTNRFLPGFFALAVCLLQAGTGLGDENLYRKVAPSTAMIISPRAPGAVTGFVVDGPERLLVTTYHAGFTSSEPLIVIFAQTKDGEVINDKDYYTKNRDKLAIKGKVVFHHADTDLAVI